MTRLFKRLNVSGNASYWWGLCLVLSVFLAFNNAAQATESLADTIIAMIGIAIIWDLSYFLLWNHKRKQSND